MDSLPVGVLALQGAFDAHERALLALGIATMQVRTPADLAGCRALIMPGGESTTMSRLLETADLFGPLHERISAGMPVFGTCAGMILLAAEVIDGRPDQRSFAAIDISVRRNGYGRQIDSFEGDVVLGSSLEPTPGSAVFHAVFIRAPKVVRVGLEVTVLATHEGTPVLVQQGSIFVASFHPELTDDSRLHEHFVSMVAASPAAPPTSTAV